MNVGIALSAYNHQEYIIQAVKSIIDQSYQDWQLAIFLNNSTDNSHRIIYDYIASCGMVHKIKIIEFPFVDKVLPIGIARYLMVNHFLTDYNAICPKQKVTLICIIDADDFWRKDKLEKQVALYKKNRSKKLIFSDCYYYYQDERIEQIDNFPAYVSMKLNRMRRNIFHEKYPPLMSNPFQNLLLKYNFMPCPTLMFEKEALRNVIGNPTPYTSAEDYDWIVKMTQKYECAYVQEPLAFYRIHKDQLTAKTPARCTMEEIDVFKRFMKYLPKRKAQMHLVWLYCKLIWKETKK